MWNKLMKLVDLGERTSFLDHVYMGCTQRECKSNERTIDEYRKVFDLRISTGATEKLFGWKKISRATTVERNFELAIKRLSNCTKSVLHAWTTITSCPKLALNSS